MLSRTPIEVTPGVWATGEVPRKSFETIMELGKSRLLKVEGGSETLDSIPDDQSLSLLGEGRRDGRGHRLRPLWSTLHPQPRRSNHR